MIFYENHKVYMNGEYPAIFLDGKNQHINIVELIQVIFNGFLGASNIPLTDGVLYG